jgi:hypothetical protein
MTFGVLTLATRGDYQKAIGLALSLRVSNPGVSVAVACSPGLRPVLSPYFDHVIDEAPALRGFVHKVHLDRYTPFDDTFFFDSDVLVFKPLGPIVEAWGDRPYNACGEFMSNGISYFGLDRAAVCRKLGAERLVTIDGAGHTFFRKPACIPVFELAREVTRRYGEYAGEVRYADEDVMNIVLTMMGIEPRPRWDFFSRHLTATPGTLQIDAVNGRCEMVERATGKVLRPYMMHFAANEGPFTYARELRKLFVKFGADPSGLYRIAIADFFEIEVRWRIGMWMRKLLSAAKAKARSVQGQSGACP